MFGPTYLPPASLRRSNERITTEIVLLSTRAAGTPPGRRAALYESAARLCCANGRDGQARLFFGCTIDDRLVGGAYAEADALCAEFIDLYPDLVRARCTFAFLALRAEGSHEFAGRAARYEASAVTAYQASLAVARFALMRRVCPDAQTQDFLDQRLGALRARIGLSPATRSPLPSAKGAAERWRRALHQVIIGPTAGRRHYDPVMGGN